MKKLPTKPVRKQIKQININLNSLNDNGFKIEPQPKYSPIRAQPIVDYEIPESIEVVESSRFIRTPKAVHFISPVLDKGSN